MPSRRDLANAIRALSMDAVQKANSGHPGAPMGMADIAEVLWNDFLRHNPNNPAWPDRDRFVLSNGHASMLLYSLLHLTGYDVSIDDLKNFRQLHSKTPGHPEFGITPGVETTTGPLGQGLANAVGMAIAEKNLAEQFNSDDIKLIDHYTYAFAGDGCLMEGISHEACSLAGTLHLGKLIVFYDDNGISIDGRVSGWFTDNTVKRFDAYDWHVIRRVNGHDPESIRAAIEEARSVTHKPSLLVCRTTIGYGSPNKQGTAHCHGAPLGEDEIQKTKKLLHWPHSAFDIPDPIYKKWDAREKGRKQEQVWQDNLKHYARQYPDLAEEFVRRFQGNLPDNWPQHSQAFIQQTQQQAESIATRKASQNCLNAYAPLLPEIMGGSADLTPSNLTDWDEAMEITDDPAGNYIHYGVREFGMAAIMNGMVCHGGIIPFGGTFLMFSEYARNALRMAALMKIRSIYVFTHDSIGLGEDGPTHQPVEQISTLRMIPNMSVWRPCDATETAVAWKAALERQHGPTALVLSRQTLTHQKRDAQQLNDIKRGAYILKEPANPAKAIIIATGSEVEIAMQAAAQLSQMKIPTRVVSMPSCDHFDAQDEAYQNAILPPHISARVAIEAGVTRFWKNYVGLQGKVIGIDRFGESAPAESLFEYFGITVEHTVEAVKSCIQS